MKKLFHLSMGLIVLAFVAHIIFTKAVMDSAEEKSGQPSKPSIVSEKKQNLPKNNKRAMNLTSDSIPVMAEKEFEGSDLKLDKALKETDEYTSYLATYKSEGLKISAVMNVPKSKGPLPIIILNHGYMDPKVYKSGSGVPRELDYFAKHGYVVFQSDYRGYGTSDLDPSNDVRPRSGYVEDDLNAISALKKSDLDFLDKENIGMLGHSMGGGIALNIMVTKPDSAKAYVLLAPIHSDYKVNFDKWVKTEWPETAQQFYRIYGTYKEKPEIWESFSAKNYFDRINAPVMLHQGSADSQVPAEWSRDLFRDLKDHKKDVAYHEYPGEEHVFSSGAHSVAMKKTLSFFDKELK